MLTDGLKAQDSSENESDSGEEEPTLHHRQWAPICYWCKRFYKKSETFACEAFPDGIPQAIYRNEHDHRQSFPGDGGKLFDPENEEANNRANWRFKSQNREE